MVKSPLNYVGGKFKLLPQILPLFPDKIDTFVDLFCGGCNVAVNVSVKKIIANDISKQVISLLDTFKGNNKKIVVDTMLEIIQKYKLSDSTIQSYSNYGCNASEGLGKYNKEAYLNLRKDYNTLQEPGFMKNIMFYILVCYSFSNQIRFNNKGEFNMPYGKRDFNKNLRNNLNLFLNRLHELNIFFLNQDFSTLKTEKLTQNDFVYCDPPYLITCASYNEQNGWNEKHERDLLKLLDRLNERGIKFALSNVIESKGASNDILKDWAKQYIIHHLDYGYSNANYQRKDKGKDSTLEVLITNY